MVTVGIKSDNPNPPLPSHERLAQIAFCALQLLRQVVTGKNAKHFSDWRDADDWIFSELGIEIGELEAIYQPYYEDVVVYGDSCFEDDNSPKDYDRTYYTNPK